MITLRNLIPCAVLLLAGAVHAGEPVNINTADAETLAGLRTRYGSTTLIQIDRNAWLPTAGHREPLAAGAVQVTAARSFADAWKAATAPAVQVRR